MDLYFSNCRKTAKAAASKVAAGSLSAHAKQCSFGSQKKPILEVGAAHLLDLPLGAKLPVIPGSNSIFYTTNISEKLYQPSYDFNLTDPYCQLLETSYKSLHDPHLKAYYKRKDILRKLKEGGYITSNNKVVCTLKEFNKYRHYLTSLKLDFERNYTREQKMIEKQLNKLYETKRTHENYENARFQEWLLWESTQATPEQELLMKNRYLDIINRELNKVEHTAENQSTLRMKEEERHHRDHIRRKLNLRREIAEEWKAKEMLLLTQIGEEVKREARVEDQHKRIREEAHRKKHALLEKKIAYHLQNMHLREKNLKREGPKRSVFENKAQDELEGSIQHYRSFAKIPTKTSTFLPLQRDVQSNTTEQKKDKEMIKMLHPLNDKGIKSTSLQSPDVSDKTENISTHSAQDFLGKKVTSTDSNEKKAKKSSLNFLRSFLSRDSIKQQNYYPNSCQENNEDMKSSTELTYHFIHRIMSTPSYSEEDLPSFSSDEDDSRSVPSAKITEDSFELESVSNVKFVTLYQRESALTRLCSSNFEISGTEKRSTSKQGSEIMRKVSSPLSKVFSRPQDNVPKFSSCSPIHQDKG